jgi:hypothetical protein
LSAGCLKGFAHPSLSHSNCMHGGMVVACKVMLWWAHGGPFVLRHTQLGQSASSTACCICSVLQVAYCFESPSSLGLPACWRCAMHHSVLVRTALSTFRRTWGGRGRIARVVTTVFLPCYESVLYMHYAQGIQCSVFCWRVGVAAQQLICW